MANREVAKGRMLYKNGLAGAQPDFTDVKLKDDLKLIAELDRCLADVEGQEYACHAVKEQLFGNMNRENRDGPAAVFFFTGPSAVGKTLLAQKIAQALGRPFERLDMSAYSDREAFTSLFGLNKFYKSSAPGRLTAFINGNPVSVILMDEIEKAHPDVFNLLLQVLEDGRLTDSQGRTVDFRNTVIIMTSNAGAPRTQQAHAVGFGTAEDALTHERLRETMMAELKKTFRPEFLNRVDEIIVFRPLAREETRAITRLMLETVKARLRERGIALTVTPEAEDLLSGAGFDPLYGARPLRRAIQHQVEDSLSEEILSGRVSLGDAVTASAEDGKLVFRKA